MMPLVVTLDERGESMMREREIRILALALLAFGCDGAAEEATDTPSASTDGDATAGGDDDAVSDGLAGVDSADAADGSDAQDGVDGADSAGPSAAPTQSGVEARVSGRAGHDLRIELVGKDPNGDATGVHVEALDAAGAPVLAFRASLSVDPDSAETTQAFDAPVKGASFVGSVTFRGLAFEHPLIASMSVAVVDAAGNAATSETVAVAPQTLAGLGEACDAKYVTSRCGAGFGCRGTPPACAEGLAPELTQLAYLNDAAGARILLAGEEPEDDLATIHLEFLDAAGAPLQVDFDGDEAPDGDAFDVDATGKGADGAFFVRVDPAGEFGVLVPQIAATAIDAAGHSGARKTIKQTKPSAKGSGSTCDPRGFDACTASSVCSPGVVGVANTCKAVASLRASECNLAPEIVVAASGTEKAVGLASGPSLWDAPVGCSSADPVGRPEGSVRVVLSEAVAKLTLSTAEAGTNFDTVVYLLPACGVGEPMGCSDDTEGEVVSAAGTLTLEKVEAGEYLVVVDSWGAAGGVFTLSVSAQ